MVWELTHSAFYLGVIGFCESAPRFVFGFLGGVIADRVDRLKLLALAEALTAAQVAIFAMLVFSQTIEFWHIVLLVIFIAVVNSVSTTT